MVLNLGVLIHHLMGMTATSPLIQTAEAEEVKCPNTLLGT